MNKMMQITLTFLLVCFHCSIMALTENDMSYYENTMHEGTGITSDMSHYENAMHEGTGKPKHMRVKRHMHDHSLFIDNNETGCYVLYHRKTMSFITVTSNGMAMNNDSIALCEETSSDGDWNPNCYDKVLFSLNTLTHRCNLESGQFLSMCLVFYNQNQEVFDRFYCRIKLEWKHSSGIVFDERLYYKYCPGRRIPIYLLHYGFHTIDIFPFLGEKSCKNQTVLLEESIHRNLTSFRRAAINDESNNNSVWEMELQWHTGLLVPLCVMEEGMKNPSHCKIPFELWRGEDMFASRPPTECSQSGYASSKAYLIPFISNRACHSGYIYESAICIVNASDLSYDMCKTITPIDMISEIIDYNTSHYEQLQLACYNHLHPEIPLTKNNRIDMFSIPLTSMPSMPLIESACMEMWEYLSPNIDKNLNGTYAIYVKKIPEFEEISQVFINIAFGFIGLGFVLGVFNVSLALQMLRHSYTVVVSDVYIVFIVVFLFLGLITETIHVALANELLSECIWEYLEAFMGWLSATVFLFLIALCYDRTYSIARPFLARSRLTVKRARTICIIITLSTFTFRMVESVARELEYYFFEEVRCTYTNKIWYKSPTNIFLLVTGSAYIIGWLFLLMINIVLVYNLIRNAHKWKREVPCHQVVSIAGICICHLLFSLMTVNTSAIGPLVSHIIVNSLVSSSSTLGIVLKLHEIDKYLTISTCINSLQHFMVGLFLLGFTPKYKDMILQCCCKIRPDENSTPNQRRGRHNSVDTGDRVFVECSAMPHQMTDFSDYPTDIPKPDEFTQNPDQTVLTCPNETYGTTVFVNVEMHVKSDGFDVDLDGKSDGPGNDIKSAGPVSSNSYSTASTTQINELHM